MFPLFYIKNYLYICEKYSVMVASREQIHSFIDRADEKILKVISALMDMEENNEIPKHQQKILDERLKTLQEKPNQGKPFREVSQSIRKKYGI